MSYLFENQNPAVLANGFNTNKAVALGSTVAITGAVTMASTLAVTGAVTFSTAPTGPRVSTTTNSATVGATVVLTAAQSGGVFINASTSGSPSWTLPAAANGLEYTFICANTTTGFTVTAAGTIYAKTSATGTAISGTTLTNTQATAVVGDSITLVSDGTGWRMKSQSGIFAAA